MPVYIHLEMAGRGPQFPLVIARSECRSFFALDILCLTCSEHHRRLSRCSPKYLTSVEKGTGCPFTVIGLAGIVAVLEKKTTLVLVALKASPQVRPHSVKRSTVVCRECNERCVNSIEYQLGGDPSIRERQ